jgi:hypothetical protein
MFRSLVVGTRIVCENAWPLVPGCMALGAAVGVLVRGATICCEPARPVSQGRRRLSLARPLWWGAAFGLFFATGVLPVLISFAFAWNSPGDAVWRVASDAGVFGLLLLMGLLAGFAASTIIRSKRSAPTDPPRDGRPCDCGICRDVRNAPARPGPPPQASFFSDPLVRAAHALLSSVRRGWGSSPTPSASAGSTSSVSGPSLLGRRQSRRRSSPCRPRRPSRPFA